MYLKEDFFFFFFFFSKKASHELFRIDMTHNPAKFRFPTLKNQSAKVGRHASSRCRWNHLVRTWYLVCFHLPSDNVRREECQLQQNDEESLEKETGNQPRPTENLEQRPPIPIQYS